MSQTRYRLALVLEAALWCTAMGWLLFLAVTIRQAYKATGELDARSAFEFILLGLLVFWPMLRVRITHGYWMRDWDDAPKPPLRDADDAITAGRDARLIRSDPRSMG